MRRWLALFALLPLAAASQTLPPLLQPDGALNPASVSEAARNCSLQLRAKNTVVLPAAFVLLCGAAYAVATGPA